MPTLDASWSPQVRKISELERQDHWYLTAEHECYFFGEYTARGGYSRSSTNQIITNIKKGRVCAVPRNGSTRSMICGGSRSPFAAH